MMNQEPNDQEISAKRNNTATKRRHDNINANTAANNKKDDDQEIGGGDDKDFLALTLTFGQQKPPKKTTPNNHRQSPPPPLPTPPSPFLLPSSLYHDFQNPLLLSPQQQTLTSPLSASLSPSPNFLVDPYNNTSATATVNMNVNVGSSRAPRSRRNPNQTQRDKGKSESIPPPYPWATNQRATVHNLEYLLSKKIDVITGLVQCKRCEKQYEMGFDLKEKFYQVGTFIAENKNSMHDRAPTSWMIPDLPTCKFCNEEKSVKPVISDKKKGINWLFLLLGQMLGCCTLEQLKYFCKHTKNHRTGAKDRVLYLTYLGLCKQLDPRGPFGR